MGTFKEFTGLFKKEYSREEKETNRMLYGDDEDKWPDADDDDEGPISIDLYKVEQFNDYHEKDCTTVSISGSRFILKISYDEFKKIMNAIP